MPHSRRDVSNRRVQSSIIIYPHPLRRKMLRIPKHRKLVHFKMLLANRSVKPLNIRILLRIARLRVFQFNPMRRPPTSATCGSQIPDHCQTETTGLAPPRNQTLQNLHNMIRRKGKGNLHANTLARAIASHAKHPKLPTIRHLIRRKISRPRCARALWNRKLVRLRALQTAARPHAQMQALTLVPLRQVAQPVHNQLVLVAQPTLITITCLRNPNVAQARRMLVCSLKTSRLARSLRSCARVTFFNAPFSKSFCMLTSAYIRLMRAFYAASDSIRDISDASIPSYLLCQL